MPPIIIDMFFTVRFLMSFQKYSWIWLDLSASWISNEISGTATGVCEYNCSSATAFDTRLQQRLASAAGGRLTSHRISTTTDFFGYSGIKGYLPLAH